MTQADLYALLALPLTPPDPEAWAPLCSGEWTEALAGFGLAAPSARPYPIAAEEYRQAFLEPGHRLIPVESYYKPWTTLPDAAMPLAGQKGWLGGDPAVHLRALYDSLGVTVPSHFAYAPDHLALELEFLSLLLEQGGVEQAALFRSQHLDWVGDLAADAARHGVPAFYRDLFKLILDACRT